tara:strand:+ start:7441 stop:7929 length:489 start_codon:yes stop_codon:yes gene_type:complete
MAWGYAIGALVGGVIAHDAKKREQARQRRVASETSKGILDLQPLYSQYRQDAATMAGLRFDQQGLQVDQARAGYMADMSGYGRAGLAGYSNPALGDPTSRLAAIGLQGEASLLQQSQALEQRLGTIDAAERQLRAQALEQGVSLPSVEALQMQDNIKKGNVG